MSRFRIIALPDPQDPSRELRRLSDVRRDLWAHSSVEIDPDNPAYATRRDRQRQAYFEFASQFPEQVVADVIKKWGHRDFVKVETLPGTAAEPCLRCGHTDEVETPAVCPECGLRDIASCPNCDRPISRQAYIQVAGDLYRCPQCRHHVRLSFNDPLRLADGSWNEPVVLVASALPERV